MLTGIMETFSPVTNIKKYPETIEFQSECESDGEFILV